MDSTRERTLIGVAMAVLGLAQATYYAVQGESIPLALGLVLAAIGVAYLWVEGIAHSE